MPIPAFDHNYVLPPHLGSPTNNNHLSPYLATTVELVQRFGTSSERIQILNGLLNFRVELQQYGLINGFQWLDGSFLEDIEIQENRPPRDLDLVTMFWGYDLTFQHGLVQQIPEFANSNLSKKNYMLDHYGVDAGLDPSITIELTRYWVQLFSHNRNKVWKGMIKIALNTPNEDALAIQSLQNLQP